MEKIANAIFRAAQAVGGSDYDQAMALACEVSEKIDKLSREKGVTPTVEQIQDMVEHILIERGHARTAKEYILYRAERTKVREMSTRLMKVYEDLTFQSAKDNDIKRENANIDGDTAMGTMLKYGSEGAKQLNELYDKKTELENLEIISTVRAMVMDKDQVMAFLSSMKGGKPTKQPTTTHQEVTENE